MKTTQSQRDNMRRYYIKNKDLLSLYKKEYYKTHKDIWIKYQDTPEYKKRAVEYNQRMRLAAIDYYGKVCQCCGEEKTEFLAIDHINGGGGKHRREIRGSLFSWLKVNNYPKGFRVLCHNCNLSLGFYKYCPHKDIVKLKK